MKKKILISMLVSVFIILLAIVFYVNADNREKTLKKKTDKIITTTSKNDVYVEELKPEENVQEDHKVSSKDKPTVTETKKTTTSVKSSTNVKTDNKTIVTTTNSSKKETTTIQTTTSTTKSCISKKFNQPWFRADFKTEKECRNKGEQYKGNYGYFCDSLPDECGEIWYMLSLYDSNGEYDWHNIK